MSEPVPEGAKLSKNNGNNGDNGNNGNNKEKAKLNWKGPFCAISLLLTAFFGTISVLVPCVLLVIFSPKYWRYWVDVWVGFWFSLPVALLEFIYGSKIHVSGDKITRGNPALILMNHRTRLDWLYFWSALYKMDPLLLGSEKISLKSILKKIPGAGWAMQCGSCIFLDRKREADVAIINDTIDYFADIGKPYQILLFPEGTDLSPYNREKGRKYAEENDWPDYDYVLHPRTAGFIHMLDRMRQDNFVKYVYDVTVAYGENIVTSEMDFLKGTCPKDIRFHIHRYDVSQLPLDHASLTLWCQKVWQQKEEILRQFYEHKDSLLKGGKTKDETNADNVLHNSPEKISPELLGSITREVRGRSDDQSKKESSKPSVYKNWPVEFRGKQLAGLVTSFLYWTFIPFPWYVSCFLVPKLLLYFVFVFVLFYLTQRYYNGMERWVIRHHLDALRKAQ